MGFRALLISKSGSFPFAPPWRSASKCVSLQSCKTIIRNLTMKRTLLTILTVFALKSCQDTSKSSEDHHQNTQQKTYPRNVKDKEKSVSRNKKEDTEDISTPSLFIKDFDKVENNYSSLNGGQTGNYLSNKGFALLDETKHTTKIEFTLIKSKPKEILEISYSQFPEGDKSFVINYYLASKMAYEMFINSLKQRKFSLKKTNKRYEIFMGTYEDLYVCTNGPILKNNERYYWVKYLHYQGKEISEAPWEERLSKDTIK